MTPGGDQDLKFGQLELKCLTFVKKWCVRTLTTGKGDGDGLAGPNR